MSAVGPTNIEGAAKMSNLLLLLLVSKFMLYGSDTHDFMVLFMSRDRANIRRFEFDCIIRIYSDFASSSRVRKITRCFEVSRTAYKNGPQLGTADAKATFQP